MQMPQQNWRETLPEEWMVTMRNEDGSEQAVPLREHPSLRKYASKDEAVKALVHAQKLLGRRPEGYVRVPGSDAGEEELAEYRAALGLPESPDGYDLPELELPEDFEIKEEISQAFLEKAYELGLTPGQVQGLYQWFLPLNVAVMQEMLEGNARNRDNELEALRDVHRGETPQVLDAARQAALALGGEELLAVLDETGAANRAVVINGLARMAPMLLEGRFRFRDAHAPQGMSRAKLLEMMRDPRYHDPLQRDPAFVEQVSKGFEQLYPGKYAPGSRI